MATGMTGGLPGAVSEGAPGGVSANRLLGGEVTSPESAEPDRGTAMSGSGADGSRGLEPRNRFLPCAVGPRLLDLRLHLEAVPLARGACCSTRTSR